MNFTEAEKERLFAPKLRPYCCKMDGKFLAKARISDVTISGKKFDTIEECNAEHDRMMDDENLRIRALANKFDALKTKKDEQ